MSDSDGGIVWYKRAPEQQLFAVGPLFVTRWSNAARLSMLRDQNDAQTKHMATHDGKLPILAIIDQTSMPALDQINDEFREAARTMAKQNEDYVLAISYVIGSSGFVASITRSVVAGINMVMRSPYGTKVHSSLDEGIAWLDPHIEGAGMAYDRARLEQAIAEVRTEF
jgi:hypothetical protein